MDSLAGNSPSEPGLQSNPYDLDRDNHAPTGGLVGLGAGALSGFAVDCFLRGNFIESVAIIMAAVMGLFIGWWARSL